MYNWITLLYTWDKYNIVNQLYCSTKNFFFKKELGPLAVSEEC